MHILQGNTGGIQHYLVKSMAYSPDGQFLAAAASFHAPDAKRLSREIGVWDLTQLKRHVTLTKGIDDEPCVAFGADGRLFTFGGTLRIWDVTTWKLLPTLKPMRGSKMQQMAISPDNKCLATIVRGPMERNQVKVWDLTTGKLLDMVQSFMNINTLAFCPNGQYLALGDSHFYDLNSRARISAMFHRETVSQFHCIRFSPDGRFIASACVSGIKLWEFAIERFDRPTVKQCASWDLGWIPSFAFTPDGNRLVFAKERNVHILELPTGRELACYDFGGSMGLTVAVAPDGMTAVVGGHGPNSLVIWDI